MVDSYNTWFYDDINKIPDVWSGWGCNKESVTGLFKFYNDFKFERYVDQKTLRV